MSYQNRQEDLEKALTLKIGEEFDFHVFQEQGATIKRISEDSFELYEMKWGGDLLDSIHTKETLLDAINMVYEEWT